ncbi:hypothetical protein TARUN_4693 [Trichoderma arundinaceum]|uniref:Uncharacterized protein n=1 Tax=Trichoderma arundinaceum TaxID=490622 RepID=A0A395NNR1_TRIAR|nr:hypothetical protein TARUN_4693 [Trichoderma arundinaceum]
MDLRRQERGQEPGRFVSTAKLIVSDLQPDDAVTNDENRSSDIAFQLAQLGQPTMPSNLSFPHVQPPSCLAMMCFSIRYTDAEEKRGCLTQFLDESPTDGYLPQHYSFKYERFLAVAGEGLQQLPDGWTSIVDDERVSFRHAGT